MGADMFERFTDRARRVVVLAQEEARLLRHNYIGTEHLLLGILAEGDGTAYRALHELGLTLELGRQQVEAIIGTGKKALSGHIPFTPRAKKVLELSLREALKLGHNYIGTEHILLGILREGEGVAAQVLAGLGDDLPAVRAHVVRLAVGGKVVAARESEEVAAEAMARMTATRTGVHELLQDISQRLANIETHLGIARPDPRARRAGGREPGDPETGVVTERAAGDDEPDPADDGPDAAEE
jgi:ATP-dependent Clp protease ATP-binding subunit ClpA